jgi:hypothetical protein
MASLKNQLVTGLVSMKKAVKPKTSIPEPCCDYEEYKYPYSLRMTLDNEALEKLDLGAADFTAGEDVVIVCKCNVTEVSSRETTKKEKNDRVELQVTALNIEDTDGKS